MPSTLKRKRYCALARQKPSGKPLYVIQKHAARTLHYDFRLQVGGVLKSWAVPKGPSTDSRDRRLAVPVEDHPIDYAFFEGVIPEGHYGAGVVLVWDIGTYRNLGEKSGSAVSVDDALEQGRVAVWIEGQKLKGGYTLVRTAAGGERRWLLIKMDDDEADRRRNPVSTEPQSVLTGRTIEEIAREESCQRVGVKKKS
ncbi:MAG: DNA ligase [Candidatus Aureabacteria bacterium]|nr:DNA ligase [Candidatus Auribacterota bacterium]